MNDRDLMRLFYLVILLAFGLTVYITGTRVGWWS